LRRSSDPSGILGKNVSPGEKRFCRSTSDRRAQKRFRDRVSVRGARLARGRRFRASHEPRITTERRDDRRPARATRELRRTSAARHQPRRCFSWRVRAL
jgi:hypothetical protein